MQINKYLNNHNNNNNNIRIKYCNNSNYTRCAPVHMHCVGLGTGGLMEPQWGHGT